MKKVVLMRVENTKDILVISIKTEKSFATNKDVQVGQQQLLKSGIIGNFMKSKLSYVWLVIGTIVSISILHQLIIKISSEFHRIETWSGMILYSFASIFIFALVSVILFVANWLIYYGCNNS